MAGWLVIRRVGEDDDEVIVQTGGLGCWHGWRVAVAVFVIGRRRWLNASPANSPGRSGCRAARSRASRAAGSGVLDESALTAKAKLAQDIEQGKVVPPGTDTNQTRIHE